MLQTNEKYSVEEQAISAKKAAKQLSLLTTEQKNDALLTIASTLESNTEYILKANEVDLKNGKEKGFDEALMDRLA
ncbi:MAG: gamma-glutamyl-phosphate reductase, partial [Priestia megaterium]